MVCLVQVELAFPSFQAFFSNRSQREVQSNPPFVPFETDRIPFYPPSNPSNWNDLPSPPQTVLFLCGYSPSSPPPSVQISVRFPFGSPFLEPLPFPPGCPFPPRRKNRTENRKKKTKKKKNERIEGETRRRTKARVPHTCFTCFVAKQKRRGDAFEGGKGAFGTRGRTSCCVIREIERWWRA